MTSIAVAFRRVLNGGASSRSLPGDELALLTQNATPKRRAEFAAGRSAARAALVRLLGVPACDCVVLRDRTSGTARPVPVSATGRDLAAFVSITHASGYAVAIAGAERLGIDLVEVEPIGRAFRDEAFSMDELAAWEAFTGHPAGSDLAACAAFAAKEAAVKWLGTGLAVPLLSVAAVPVGQGRVGRLGRLVARSFTLDVRAPGLRRRLCGVFATPSRFVLVAACEVMS